MEIAEEDRFSGPVTVFQQQRLPERATPAGYAALIGAYNLKIPLPRTLFGIGERHRTIETAGWRIMSPRHAPHASLEGHLTFALKYEGLDLAILKRLFMAAGPGKIESILTAKPTGGYARRIWFLYEWLTGSRLDLADAKQGAYVPVVDPELQWAGQGTNSSRQRVRDNLPGTPDFCPLVSRSKPLEEFLALDLSARARAAAAKVPRNLIARAAAYLLLKDSKSSYVIEGENPPQDRIQRWGRAISEAGRTPLDLDELLRLQRIVIGDERFTRLGLRTEGGFVGVHDRDTRAPIPDHVSARPEDLPSLVRGLIEFDRGPARQLDAVMAAAVLAFGFVYIHPFVDGNGRIHRYMIHHVLARRGFNPAGVVFPVSAAILEEIERYRAVLEDYSKRLLPAIEWRASASHNVEVLNDTGDFYRFFDATPHAEFLYACIRKTIEEDLPREADILGRYDRFREQLANVIDMPDSTVDLLFRFLQQNGGHLSKRAREQEFAQLTDAEAARIESLYAEIFKPPRATGQ